MSVKGANGNGLLNGVIAIAAAQNHTCALLNAGGGTVKCWGRNNTGVLGNGSTTRRQALTPESVAGLTRVTAISTSIHNTCAVLKGGTVKCWGFSQYGELGPGIVGPENCPFSDFDFGCSTKPLTVKGITGATAVSVRDHSSCAVVKKGKVTCWGDSKPRFVNVHGHHRRHGDHVVGRRGVVRRLLVRGAGLQDREVLGLEPRRPARQRHHQEQRPFPPTSSGLTDVTAISAGRHVRVRAPEQRGAVTCWGANRYGQLGNGGKPSQLKPVKVIGL